MKAKEKKVTVKNRMPYEKLSDTEKKKIVHEINSGLIGQRAAARKYGLNRKTVGAWVVDFSSFNIKPREVAEEAISKSLGGLCELFGVTRQAYYDAAEHEKKTSIAHMLVLSLVREYRSDIPLIGTRKLLFMLVPDLAQHGIKIGRDQLFELLRFHGLLIRRRKRIVKTTDSHHWLKKYPNLIKGLEATGANQLWVSDLTYIRTLEGFSYLSLITDAFSRKIVGFSLYQTLEAAGCISALKIAFAERRFDSPYFLIHHSDRGIQYCSAEYVSILNDENIAISMTQSGSPNDNALAERVNGIIKNEFYPKRVYQNHKEAAKAITKIIHTYNNKRPHASIDYLTPNQAHTHEGSLLKRWKRYQRKRKNVPEPVEV